MTTVQFVLDQRVKLKFNSANALKQQSAPKYVTLFRHIGTTDSSLIKWNVYRSILLTYKGHLLKYLDCPLNTGFASLIL